jgi:hypothetical protein
MNQVCRFASVRYAMRVCSGTPSTAACPSYTAVQTTLSR